MAVYSASLSLKDTGFPLISRWAGRPVIIRNIDVPALEVRSPTEGASDVFHAINKPMLAFCENVLPKLGGYSSIGYATLAASLMTPAGVKRIFTIRTHDLISGASLTDTLVWFGTAVGGGGLSSAEYLTATAHALVTLPAAYPTPAYISLADSGAGAYFLFSNGTTTNLYDFGTTAGVPSFSLVTLTGISAADLNAVRYACMAGNYLVLVKKDGTAFWSNPQNITDFAPSLTTGAGFLLPTGMLGEATGVQALGDGFIIYTTKNSVVARFSNNAQVPWLFAPLSGSAAVYESTSSGKLAVTTANVEVTQYAWTTAGLQQFSIARGAQGLFPDVSDFLASDLIEELNGSGKPALTAVPLSATARQVDVMVTQIGQRFITISYGRFASPIPYFTYALVYDLYLRRWGKLKIDHIEPVFLPAAISGAEIFKQLGFLALDGSIKIATEDSIYYKVNGDGIVVSHNATLLVGGISLTRGGMLQLNTVDITYGDVDATITVKQSTSDDNVNIGSFMPMERVHSNTGSASYGCRKVGRYHTISINGKFNITYLGFECRKAGIR